MAGGESRETFTQNSTRENVKTPTPFLSGDRYLKMFFNIAIRVRVSEIGNPRLPTQKREEAAAMTVH